MSDVFAMNDQYEIEFDDSMLHNLTKYFRMSKIKQLDYYEGQNFEKMELFISNCLFKCSIINVLELVNDFPHHLVEIDIHRFNWDKYIEN